MLLLGSLYAINEWLEFYEQVGYIVAGMKNSAEARVGDTIHHKGVGQCASVFLCFWCLSVLFF